jgi:outer membrane protein TolC
MMTILTLGTFILLVGGMGMVNSPSHARFSTVEATPMVGTRSVADRLQQGNLQANKQELAIKLTLSDVVAVALQNNRTLKNAYLARIIQREELAVVESKFSPRFSPEVSSSVARSSASGLTTSTGNLKLQGQGLFKFLAGAELKFGLSGNLPTTIEGNSSSGDNQLRSGLEIDFTQPLLKRAGINVNTASIKLGRLNELGNILALKSTLNDTITSAILAFRELLRAQEQLKIEQISLRSAQELLEFNRALIKAGRLAPVDLAQSETSIANRAVILAAAQNTLATKRLDLVAILGVGGQPQIFAADSLEIATVALDFNRLRQIAVENQPNFLQTQLGLEKTKLDLLQAENNRLWDLSLNVNFRSPYNSVATDATNNLQAKLVLTREFGDRSLDRDVLRSQTNQIQIENTIKEERQKLEIQIAKAISDIQLSRSQLDLSRKATELSVRQLEIEQEKKKLGRGGTIFTLVRLQDDLTAARNRELNTIIDYLNTLTILDRTLGTTLTTWGVTIEQGRV